LKGRQRGQPMTAASLRSLFRYHRVRSRIANANPHRMRHYSVSPTITESLKTFRAYAANDGSKHG
ncbi:MAG TPA: hypothetical protein VM912_13420, partial [Terriglobales bacterium]|nr:hypothetical protein [Terriglobales bacterium]